MDLWDIFVNRTPRNGPKFSCLKTIQPGLNFDPNRKVISFTGSSTQLQCHPPGHQATKHHDKLKE
jgi:hypothetical protein